MSKAIRPFRRPPPEENQGFSDLEAEQGTDTGPYGSVYSVDNGGGGPDVEVWDINVERARKYVHPKDTLPGDNQVSCRKCCGILLGIAIFIGIFSTIAVTMWQAPHALKTTTEAPFFTTTINSTIWNDSSTPGG